MLHQIGFQGPEYEARRAGHVLGLAKGAKIKEATFKQTVIQSTEGAFDSESVYYIHEKLRQYQPPTHKAEWQMIKETFDDTTNDVSQIYQSHKNLNDVCHNQLKRYKQDKPIHICTGWTGHTLGVTFYKGYMVVTNRGEGGEPGAGTIVYKLNEPLRPDDLYLLQEFIRDKKQQNYGGGDTIHRADVEKVLHRLQGQRIASFPQNAQKRGTCSYVNKQANTEGMMCLLALNRQGKLNDQNIKQYANNPEHRKVYRDFTRSNRASEIQRIVHLIKKAETNGNKKQLRVMVNIAFRVLKKYNNDRQRRYDKLQDETRDAGLLLKAIAPHANKLSSENQRDFLVEYNKNQNKLAILSNFDPSNMMHSQLLKPVHVKGRKNVPNIARDAHRKVIPDKVLEAAKKHLIEKLYEYVMPADLFKAFKSPPWHLPLENEIQQATNFKKIDQALKRVMRKHTNDEALTKLRDNFDKVVDYNFAQAIAHADSIEQLKRIIAEYPKNTIFSPSGSEYSRQQVITQLSQNDLRGITSALGLREAVGRIQHHAKAERENKINAMLDRKDLHKDEYFNALAEKINDELFKHRYDPGSNKPGHRRKK